MRGPCEHCSNPDKALWTTQCKYKGSYPSRTAFVRSTFDAPCSFDAYDEGQRELARLRRIENVAVLACGFGIAVITVGLVWVLT